MKTEILILRHAKSDWHTTSASDFDRPLNARGKKDAARIGQWIEEQQRIPQVILCSPALRTQQTLSLVLEQLSTKPVNISFPDSLYLASLDDLLNNIEATDISAHRIMLVTHNPGADQLLTYLCQDPLPLTDDGKLMTTASLAILGVAAAQRSKKHAAKLVDLIRPKALARE